MIFNKVSWFEVRLIIFEHLVGNTADSSLLHQCTSIRNNWFSYSYSGVILISVDQSRIWYIGPNSPLTCTLCSQLNPHKASIKCYHWYGSILHLLCTGVNDWTCCKEQRTRVAGFPLHLLLRGNMHTLIQRLWTWLLQCKWKMLSAKSNCNVLL